MDSKRHPQIGFQKTSKKYDFQHPQMWLKSCKYWQNQLISANDFNPLLGLILEVFWEPKWRLRPLKSHLKKHQKKYAQNDRKLVPKGVPKWSQNRQTSGLGSILFQGWLPSGLQTPSRIDFGKVLEPFWDNFRQFF